MGLQVSSSSSLDKNRCVWQNTKSVGILYELRMEHAKKSSLTFEVTVFYICYMRKKSVSGDVTCVSAVWQLMPALLGFRFAGLLSQNTNHERHFLEY
jgi:hypothetical protein